jgi:hypothetical protein
MKRHKDKKRRASNSGREVSAQPADDFPSSRWLTGREVAEFGVLVGLLGIFYDAALAHGLFWENDPYWTYWVTKAFLITTVFSLTTAFFGIGLVQGALATLVHTAILEVYYQFLSPVGLPREPQWLSFDHLWITGVPVHYGVIFAGYATTLWLWRRRAEVATMWQPSPRRLGAFALLATALVLALDGVIVQALILRENPGLTFFVARALIALPFFFWLASYVALDLVGVVAGSVLLALAWTTYGIYLGPTGLPWGEIKFAGYETLWLRAFPGQVVAMLLGTWLAARLTGLERPHPVASEPGVAPYREGLMREVA